MALRLDRFRSGHYGAPPLQREPAPTGIFPRVFPMTEGTSQKPLEDLDARLRRARAEGHPPAPDKDAGASMTGFGVAFRIGLELVAALAVGVGIGLALDHWLGTSPWLLIVFFFLGAAAGVFNVYRAAANIGLPRDSAEQRPDAHESGADGRP